MQTPFKKIEDVENLKGKKILLRLDLNVPIVGDEVRDDFRIHKSIPVLSLLRERGAKTIIISHLESKVTDSLSRVATYLSKAVPLKAFVSSLEDAPAVINTMSDGDIIMLENLRKNPGEKENDPVFAGRLAALADFYVNDAFAVSHREHASIVSVPRLMPAYAGPLLSEEIEQLSKAFNPERPFLFVLGGAKFDTKLPLIEKFLDLADDVFVGGALANDLFKEKGYEVGTSVVMKSRINLRRVGSHPKLMLPVDVIAVNPATRLVKEPIAVSPEDKILDAGPRTIAGLADLLDDAKLVLWNGPLGEYEKGFTEGTEGLAKAITESRAKSIIGGGDTIAAVRKMGILDKFTFASTGGGAMIEFLAKGTLPGIDALAIEN